MSNELKKQILIKKIPGKNLPGIILIIDFIKPMYMISILFFLSSLSVKNRNCCKIYDFINA